MAYKDEYEVARLYTDGEFERRLAEQFEGKPTLEFYMAPPAAGEAQGRGARRRRSKRRFGAWMLPLLKVLARGKRAARHARSICSAAPRSASSSGA